jgi:Kef-type K+ transport system membrane component KefB
VAPGVPDGGTSAARRTSGVRGLQGTTGPVSLDPPRVLRYQLGIMAHAIRLTASVVVLLGLLLPGQALAVSPPVAGPDLMPVLLAMVLILVGAQLGGALFSRIGQPPVLGELLAGVLIGNLGLVGWHGLEGLRQMPALEMLAQIGVLFLLFEVGLGTNVAQMMAVGASSMLVATLGVIAPIGLGFLVARGFFPTHHPLSHWYVGAALCATSVGITARVLSDLGRTSSREGRIILGAAVIDDVQGLLVLAVLKGVVESVAGGRAFDVGSVLVILAKAVVFLTVAIVLGRRLSKQVFQFGALLPGSSALLPLALGFCFLMSWLAGLVGLAPIVGAFSAGLVLDEVHYRELRARDAARRDVQTLLEPLTRFLVPVFFVLMGMRVDLGVFGAGPALGFTAALVAVALVSKQACSLGVLDRRTDRLAVGLGMIPRGEVGLIFASIGSTLVIAGERVVSPLMYSSVVAMVAVTTLITPPLLAWRLKRLPRGDGEAPAAGGR